MKFIQNGIFCMCLSGTSLGYDFIILTAGIMNYVLNKHAVKIEQCTSK